jgi:hypothetical protein
MDDEDGRERSEKGGTARAQVGGCGDVFERILKKGISGPGQAKDTCGLPRGPATGVVLVVIGHNELGEDVKVQTSPDNTGPVAILYSIISSASAMSSTELSDWHKM